MPPAPDMALRHVLPYLTAFPTSRTGKHALCLPPRRGCPHTHPCCIPHTFFATHTFSLHTFATPTHTTQCHHTAHLPCSSLPSHLPHPSPPSHTLCLPCLPPFTFPHFACTASPTYSPYTHHPLYSAGAVFFLYKTKTSLLAKARHSCPTCLDAASTLGRMTHISLHGHLTAVAGSACWPYLTSHAGIWLVDYIYFLFVGGLQLRTPALLYSLSTALSP